MSGSSRFSVTVLCFLLMAFATACGKQCKKAREQILEPTATVRAYLDTNPDGETLALVGCDLILDELQTLPEGAKVIREIADSRFSQDTRECLHWVETVRYRCYYEGRRPGRPGYPDHGYRRCYPEPYRYCAQWKYDTVRKPGYDEALEFSKHLDVTYDKAHGMCGEAMSGNYSQAYSESRELLKFMVAEVKPDGDRVYAMACGK